MFLLKAKGINAEQSAFHISMFNAAGIFGAISAGSLSDRLFEGRRGRAGFFFMIGLALACSALLFLPPHAHIMTSVICFLVGFFASGPQVMVSVAAVDLSSKRAAGAASGITGTFGYIGTAIAGVGLTTVADGRFGWQGAFAFMGIAAISGAMCFLFTWNARAKSFDQPQSNNATEKKAA
jgi:sugar phosphate permease